MMTRVLNSIRFPVPDLGRLAGDLTKDPNENWIDWLFTAGTSIGAILSLFWVVLYGVAALFDFDRAVWLRELITEYTISGGLVPLLEGEVLLFPLITWVSIGMTLTILFGKFEILKTDPDLPTKKQNLLVDSGTILTHHVIAVMFYNVMIDGVEMYLLPAIVITVCLIAVVVLANLIENRRRMRA